MTALDQLDASNNEHLLILQQFAEKCAQGLARIAEETALGRLKLGDEGSISWCWKQARGKAFFKALVAAAKALRRATGTAAAETLLHLSLTLGAYAKLSRDGKELFALGPEVRSMIKESVSTMVGSEAPRAQPRWLHTLLQCSLHSLIYCTNGEKTVAEVIVRGWVAELGPFEVGAQPMTLSSHTITELGCCLDFLGLHEALLDDSLAWTEKAVRAAIDAPTAADTRLIGQLYTATMTRMGVKIGSTAGGKAAVTSSAIEQADSATASPRPHLIAQLLALDQAGVRLNVPRKQAERMGFCLLFGVSGTPPPPSLILVLMGQLSRQQQCRYSDFCAHADADAVLTDRLATHLASFEALFVLTASLCDIAFEPPSASAPAYRSVISRLTFEAPRSSGGAPPLWASAGAGGGGGPKRCGADAARAAPGGSERVRGRGRCCFQWRFAWHTWCVRGYFTAPRWACRRWSLRRRAAHCLTSPVHSCDHPASQPSATIVVRHQSASPSLWHCWRWLAHTSGKSSSGHHSSRRRYHRRFQAGETRSPVCPRRIPCRR